MTRWATVIFMAAAVAFGLLRSEGVTAGEVRKVVSLLLSDTATLDTAVLDAQNARGIADTSLGIEGAGQEFGVILWDELKPARPNGPQPQPTQSGQGVSRVNATAR